MARHPKTPAPNPNPPGPEDPALFHEHKLARNLAVAFIATQQGYRSLDYVRQRYADQPVGEFWLSIARLVLEQFENRPARPPGSPFTIQ